jgi:hypothetical protein
VPKLNQVIAVEKSLKVRVNTEVDKIYKILQKPTLFDGFTKTYKKDKDEDPEDLPPQNQRVQFTAEQLARDAGKQLAQLFDVEASKDMANMQAQATVVVDGLNLGPYPVTFLLFLEKMLTDLHTVLDKAPTLDPAEAWKYDQPGQVHRTDPVLTARTKKVQKPLVLLQPTEKHPGQAEKITEDVIVGKWEQVKVSGAWTEARRRLVGDRLEQLTKALKYAREQANVIDAPDVAVGKPLFEWLFKD